MAKNPYNKTNQSPIQKQMSDFTSKAQQKGFKINEKTGEIINPTPDLVSQFNQEFTTTTNPIIPVTDLGANSQPLNFPPPTTPTYGSVEESINGAIAIGNSQMEADKVAQEAGAKDSSLKDYITELMGGTDSADYSSYDKTKAEKDRLQAQLISEQETNRKRIENLQKNPQGLFGGGLEQEVNRLNRESLSKQSDIALLKFVADNDFSNAKEILDRQVALNLEQHQTELAAKKFIYEENKAIWTKDEQRAFDAQIKKEDAALKKEEEFQKALRDIKMNVAQFAGDQAKEMLAKLSTAKTIDEAIAVAGKYGGDYYKNELLKQQIQTEKAQRANIYSQIKAREDDGGLGNYTEKQLKALTKLNQDVSKNATYAKTTAMRGYSDNVTASLSQNTGTGDIAAINQFQKVIDEGAVTRDQDVVLVQSAQSLVDSLTTKLEGLKGGDKLSPELRKQMRTTVESLYGAQIKALNKDPYINAKITEAGLYNVKVEDTILGELGAFNVQSNTPNAFEEALGQTGETIPGTSIIEGTSNDGSIDFNIPK